MRFEHPTLGRRTVDVADSTIGSGAPGAQELAREMAVEHVLAYPDALGPRARGVDPWTAEAIAEASVTFTELPD